MSTTNPTNPTLTAEECKANIQFLDRVPVTGHGERQAMNQIVQKLAQMSSPPAPAPVMQSDGDGSEEAPHA